MYTNMVFRAAKAVPFIEVFSLQGVLIRGQSYSRGHENHDLYAK